MNMKKVLLFIVASVLIFNSLKAQNATRENVARECVLYEIFTGIRCPNCPAVALGVARMLEEGKDIAAVAYHTSAFSPADLYTAETNSRANYYNVSSYPTVRTDGALCVTGGGPADFADPIYQSYLLPKYNQAIAKTSPYTIELYIDAQSGEVTATVNKVGDVAANNLRFFMVMTESHIQRSWQGLSELNFVVRDMIPSQSGITMTDEETQSFTETFDLKEYDRTNCEIVAWVQNYSSREVLQAVKFSLADLAMDNDVRIREVNDMVTNLCSGKVSPCISILNNGNANLKSVLFTFKDDNENAIETFLWEGDLAKGEMTDIAIPEFDLASSTKLIIEATEVNGVADDFPQDNVCTIELKEAFDVKGYVKMQIRTSSNPEVMTITLRNMDNGEVVNTYNYDTPKKSISEDIYLPSVGCYRLEFVSSTGNGYDGGFFKLQDATGNQVFFCEQGAEYFKYNLNIDMYSSSVVDVEEINADEISIYPNPVTSVVNISVDNLNSVSVYNAMGQLVYEQNADDDVIKIDVSSWSNGLYYVNVMTSEGKKLLQKLIVNK